MPADTSTLAHGTRFLISDLQKYKIIHYFCFHPQRFWSFVVAATVTNTDVVQVSPTFVCYIIGFPRSAGLFLQPQRQASHLLHQGNLSLDPTSLLRDCAILWSSLQQSLWKLCILCFSLVSCTISWTHPTQGLPSPLYQSCTWPCQG